MGGEGLEKFLSEVGGPYPFMLVRGVLGGDGALQPIKFLKNSALQTTPNSVGSLKMDFKHRRCLFRCLNWMWPAGLGQEKN